MKTVKISKLREFCYSQISTEYFMLAKDGKDAIGKVRRKLFHFTHFSRSYFDLSSSECAIMTSGIELFIFLTTHLS